MHRREETSCGADDKASMRGDGTWFAADYSFNGDGLRGGVPELCGVRDAFFFWECEKGQLDPGRA